MSVLKIAEPDVFALVEKHIDILRDGWKPPGEDKQRKSPFHEALERLLASCTDEERTAIKRSLHFVFRDWTRETAEPSTRPQGLKEHRHADYWQRFLSVPELCEAHRDQPVLRAILQWERNRTGKLPELVSDADRSQAVEDLAVLLSSEAAVALLARIIEMRAGERPDEWPPAEFMLPEPPGIVPVSRILTVKPLQRDRLTEVLGEAIRTHTAKNLALVRELMFLFLTETDVQPLFLDPGTIRQLRNEFTGVLAQLDPKEIIESLRGSDPWTLLYCSWGMDRLRKKGDRAAPPFEGWEEFSQRLLDALELAPDVIIPQVVPFLVKEETYFDSSLDRHMKRYEVDRELAARLFDLDRLARLLCGHLLPESAIPPTFVERYQAAISELC